MPTIAEAQKPQFTDELRSIVGPTHVLVEPSAIQRYTRDQSWLSPVLHAYFSKKRGVSGGLPTIQAVVSPGSREETKQILALATRHRVPITVRGGGTSNFGQSVALAGGLILDMTRLNRVIDITENSVRVEGGALVGDVQQAVRAAKRDLTVLTTTYTTATVGGWIGGGHVGLGANAYGTIWDGNVLEVKLLTAEERPRELTLSGQELFPALHTYGTVGVLNEVTLPLVEARSWTEELAVFDDFESACRFTAALAEHAPFGQRVIAAQQAPIPTGFTPIKHLFNPDQSVVLMMIDRAERKAYEDVAKEHGGRLKSWRSDDTSDRLSFSYMVYGHRMLWVKRLEPDASFFHVYFDPEDVHKQIQALQERFGDSLWMELKYIRSGYLRQRCGLSDEPLPLPAGVLTLVPHDDEKLARLQAVCDDLGITYWTPHGFQLQHSGLFSPESIAQIVAFKRQTDPYGLLNPGKLGDPLEDSPAQREVT